MRQSLLCILFICLFSSLSYSSEEIEYFTRHSDYQGVKVSPDGTTLAVKIYQNGVNALVFMDANALKPMGVIKAKPGDDIYNYHWVNNDRIVYEFAKKVTGHDRPMSYGQILAINKDLKGREIIYGFGASKSRTGSLINRGAKKERKASVEIISYLDNDKKHILIAEYPWTLKGEYYYDLRDKPVFISELNVYNGKKKQREVITLPGSQVLASDQGDIQFLSYVDKSNISKVYRRSGADDAPWQLLDLQGLGDETRLLDINRSGSEVYLSTRWSDTGRSGLFSLNTASLELSPLFADVPYAVSDWVEDHVTGEPAVAITEPDKFSYHYNRQGKTSKLHKMLARAFKGKRVKFADRSLSGDKIIVEVTSATHPGDFYLFDTNSKQAKPLFARYSWINPELMQKVEPIEFVSRDGKTISGYFTSAKTGASAPLLVIPHGGPHGVRDYWQFDSEAQLLAYQGYNVLQVNFRGSGGYGADFQAAGYRHWGTRMIDDIIDGTQYILDSDRVSNKQACIYGASYGGFAALMASVRAPDLYRCAIGYVGVFDLEMMFDKGDISYSQYGEGYLRKVLGTDVAQLKAQSPVNYADKIKAKVLLIPGEEDRRTPIEQSIAMRRALEKAGNKPEWLEFGQAGHGVYDENDRVKLYKRILEFLTEHLN